jgi:phosphoserine phosphatase RsbU/P
MPNGEVPRGSASAGRRLDRLDTGGLIEDLLVRAQELLAVDTVAVLLLERGGTHLVARAARGLEDEVQQGTRVPVGAGFAGRIAATRTAAALDRAGPDSVVNPILWEKRLQSMLGVPLFAGNRLVGVLHVGCFGRRSFSDDDTLTLKAVADRIANALAAQEAIAERSAARTLQDSLLPTDLPHVEGLEFASRFVAAEDFGVGGDWFDAFPLPDGQTGVVIGDVAGSGLRAAVVMGRLRSALRAYAIESRTPSEALTRLDRKFAHFEPDEMATILYVTVASDLSELTVSSTGHPPPVIANPGTPAKVLECRPSAPIGAHIATERNDVRCPLVPGTTVACYTDGLIERRRESLTDGLEHLRMAMVAGPPEDVCRKVMADLVGSSRVMDDTALLVFRRSP